MPELPEVETARRGIAPHLVGRRIASLVIRNPRLRRPVPLHLQTELAGRRIEAVERRAKYLLLRCTGGTLLVHLGMSGHLRVFSEPPPPGSHDHLDLVLDDGSLLRYRDPRRFGLFLWTTAPPGQHPLLRHLGPEPFAPEFDGAWLYARSRGRTAAVKGFLMDQRTVVGVGNIYASEALFRAWPGTGVLPGRSVRSWVKRLTRAGRRCGTFPTPPANRGIFVWTWRCTDGRGLPAGPAARPCVSR